ncbi:MAG TPA: hypothetical protein VFW09_06760 [Solirubrobacteraceae bacterium]|nr:hypothetical protein [Solirubrobacteraceae bacterium]
MINGFIAVAGVGLASLSVPPLVTLPPPLADEVAEFAALPVLLAPPQAATTAPIADADIPNTAPRRKNERRSNRPVTNSST